MNEPSFGDGDAVMLEELLALPFGEGFGCFEAPSPACGGGVGRGRPPHELARVRRRLQRRQRLLDTEERHDPGGDQRVGAILGQRLRQRRHHPGAGARRTLRGGESLQRDVPVMVVAAIAARKIQAPAW